MRLDQLRNSFVTILGQRISTLTMDEALEFTALLVGSGKPALICTANVDHLMRLRSDAEFRQVYGRASLVVADGMPLVWVSFLFGKKIPERLAGVDLVDRVAALSKKRGYRLFFLGGTRSVLDEAVKKLQRKYGRLQVKTYAPPFSDHWSDKENKKIVRLINTFKPALLFVGVGAPKQEGWIYNHLDQLSVGVAMGVGGAFEFLAGTRKRAPVWMQLWGLEWLFRLLQEPRRLWRRYLVRDLQFPILILWDLIKKYWL